ncbi:hypothetical protein HII28_19240 [Planctomonas sp. JC2975]|uniref:hypothetical protein n=1 Tax=Planctomonas sp. JC2975 TaxID=2729626 RepID=UPI00147594BF|nr:hypothetical protein [Planctomonas sp. JC2975]NNC14002.1 hypothetical protein [Planctomonas sp. JC2975]
MAQTLDETGRHGPIELVRTLTRWAGSTPWVSWLELSGSLGRGGGDEGSDVDAGIGVSEPNRLDDVEAAIGEFGQKVAGYREPFGSESTHLVTVYRDGRQLSLVVMPSTARAGLPPEAVALVDKNRRLQAPIDRARWDPDDAQKRRWTFAACLAAADAMKHSARGNRWRALRSLDEGRDLYFRLLAADQGVVFPQFGAVSLENAQRPIPSTLAMTVPVDLEPSSIASAVRALVEHLDGFIDAHHLRGLASALDFPLH